MMKLLIGCKTNIVLKFKKSYNSRSAAQDVKLRRPEFLCFLEVCFKTIYMDILEDWVWSFDMSIIYGWSFIWKIMNKRENFVTFLFSCDVFDMYLPPKVDCIMLQISGKMLSNIYIDVIYFQFLSCSFERWILCWLPVYLQFAVERNDNCIFNNS
jgi:hypothetical protein